MTFGFAVLIVALVLGGTLCILFALHNLDQREQLLSLLREQWEYNHAEHCGGEWPHPAGSECYWPPPAELQTTATMRTT